MSHNKHQFATKKISFSRNTFLKKKFVHLAAMKMYIKQIDIFKFFLQANGIIICPVSVPQQRRIGIYSKIVCHAGLLFAGPLCFWIE
jgi:hypothetical protein